MMLGLAFLFASSTYGDNVGILRKVKNLSDVEQTDSILSKLKDKALKRVEDMKAETDKYSIIKEYAKKLMTNRLTLSSIPSYNFIGFISLI